MGTRSFIGKVQADGKVRAIYCHWDGYPSNNGVLLRDHYSDPVKVDALLDLGDLSYLAPEIGEKHDFDGPRIEGQCLAYGRDRGEDGIEAKTYNTIPEFLRAAQEFGTEYAYLFSSGAWYCTQTRLKELAPLGIAIAADS